MSPNKSSIPRLPSKPAPDTLKLLLASLQRGCHPMIRPPCWPRQVLPPCRMLRYCFWNHTPPPVKFNSDKKIKPTTRKNQMNIFTKQLKAIKVSLLFGTENGWASKRKIPHILFLLQPDGDRFRFTVDSTSQGKLRQGPRFSIRIVIGIFCSDTETGAATPPRVMQKKQKPFKLTQN